MNEVKSKELMTKAEGGEYMIPLMIGDLFVSIHLYDGDCLGFFLSKNDVRVNVFENIFQDILISYPLDIIAKAEVKLIDSKELMGKSNYLDIAHEGEVYRLRITKYRKLILTK